MILKLIYHNTFFAFPGQIWLQEIWCLLYTTLIWLNRRVKLKKQISKLTNYLCPAKDPDPTNTTETKEEQEMQQEPDKDNGEEEEAFKGVLLKIDLKSRKENHSL